MRKILFLFVILFVFSYFLPISHAQTKTILKAQKLTYLEFKKDSIELTKIIWDKNVSFPEKQKIFSKIYKKWGEPNFIGHDSTEKNEERSIRIKTVCLLGSMRDMVKKEYISITETP
jgi:hypothetical protein